MSAKPIHKPDLTLPLPGAGAVARGGAIADLHREIEIRLSTALYLPVEARGEVMLASVSRFLGYASLLTGYGLIAYLFFG